MQLQISEIVQHKMTMSEEAMVIVGSPLVQETKRHPFKQTVLRANLLTTQQEGQKENGLGNHTDRWRECSSCGDEDKQVQQHRSCLHRGPQPVP